MLKDAYQKDASGKIWDLGKNGAWDEKEAVFGWVQDTNGWMFYTDNQNNLQNTWNNGAYHAKDICLYGRRILGVYPDGEYLLDEWEVIGKGKCLHGLGTQSTTYDLEGTYAVLAFSFDITAGTDYPYSGVFWNNVEDTCWENIDINLDGSCRMADINIKVGNKTVVDEENCSSHKEWTP